MKIKYKNFVASPLTPDDTGEMNCYGFAILSSGKISLFTRDGVLPPDHELLEIIENSIPEGWIYTSDFKSYRQYDATDNNSGIQGIVGPKEIFGEDPFKAYIEIFEGGEMRTKFKEYVARIEGN